MGVRSFEFKSLSLLGPITILAHMFSGLLLLSLGRHGKLCPVLDHPFDLGKHLCPFRELVYNLSEILDCPIIRGEKEERL